MNKSIIVEGYDGMGKTIVAQKLAHIFHMPLMHAGPPAVDNYHAGICSQYQLTWMMKRPCIWDRVTPISRQCYQLEIGLEHRRWLRTKLKNMCSWSIVVWCQVPNPHHDRGTHDDMDHLRFLAEHEDTIITNYRHLMLAIPHIKYDWQSGQTVEELIKAIEEAA